MYAHYIGRTEACLNDGNDCNLDSTCVDDICAILYAMWVAVAGSDVIVGNYSVVCQHWVPHFIAGLGDTPNNGYEVTLLILKDVNICQSILIQSMDLNDDGYINFREYTSIVFSLVSGDFNRGIGFNCSACDGDTYNINMNEL